MSASIRLAPPLIPPIDSNAPAIRVPAGTRTFITHGGHPVEQRGPTLRFPAHADDELAFLASMRYDGPDRCGCVALYEHLTRRGALTNTSYAALPRTLRKYWVNLVGAAAQAALRAQGFRVEVATNGTAHWIWLSARVVRLHSYAGSERILLASLDLLTPQHWSIRIDALKFTPALCRVLHGPEDCPICHGPLPHPSHWNYRWSLAHYEPCVRALRALDALPHPIFVPVDPA